VYQTGGIGGITQIFEEASYLRPTYFFDDIWYDNQGTDREVALHNGGSNAVGKQTSDVFC